MLTPLQQKIYAFVQDYINQHAHSPSLTQIASGIGISSKSISLISRHIHALVETGHLSFHKKGYRNIQITNSASTSTSDFTLPLLGKIAAGTPIEALENRQTIDLAPLLKDSSHYVLQVKGDSMIEEGIFDGDFVICKQAQRAQEGEIVVALIDQQEATLKRLSYKISDRITLIPANPTLKPKAYLPQRVQIQGIYIGLLRLQNNLLM